MYYTYKYIRFNWYLKEKKGSQINYNIITSSRPSWIKIFF